MALGFSGGERLLQTTLGPKPAVLKPHSVARERSTHVR